MTFSEGGRFEGGRVRRRRGGVVAGGGVGILAIAVFVVYQLTGVDVGPVVNGLEGGGDGDRGTTSVIEECSAAEANEQRGCRLSATVQSLDAFWAAELAGAGEVPLPTVDVFTGGIGTGCGQASSATGPFYCPADQGIYMDLGFFDVLQSRFGASGGSLAEMYVTAHEYGHHVQNVAGVMERADRSGGGAESDSVRVELQADCYAGMWAGAATMPDPDTGIPFLEPITDAQLADALSAAEAVGDDRIQETSGGSVDPHTWTHGSSEQRRRWFTTGYDEGSLEACDTFTAEEL
ncbi:neutral zinc metallopeptidase [Cellulomonas sp. APG4]|uniref:KPN_02809 family neutral zinc metallopeptidase n=1 Tax=Cellulomonas sp. APG4 TaxID=1538656 RepID=UPI00137A58E5|nr:neutral zinc metallopeptidase [Cellulomonas sp. APG4]NCT89899.1 neutral zinc metallopeptidase [Cellulomonas sp. APG4]